MTYTIGVPPEIGALSIAVAFVFFLLIIRTRAESIYHKIIPWVFHFLGFIMFVFNIRGATINFDFLHLGILCFVTGLSLQIAIVQSSSRSGDNEGK